MKNLLVVFIFLCIKANIFCQTNSDSTESKWHKGYIVLKNKPDTIKGYLQIKLSRFGLVNKVKFRMDPEKRKGTLVVGLNNFNNTSTDTIKYFGADSRNYKYLNYGDFLIQIKKNSITGWVEIIESGKIDISKGFHIGMRGNGTSAQDTYTPAYYLNKKNSVAIIIAAPTIELINGYDFMSYEIDNKNKEHFISYLSDDPYISEKVSGKQLLFRDIETSVKEYNARAKAKQ
jgi:hypothetical protein